MSRAARAALALICALACAVACASAAARGTAFADDGENTVNTQQLPDSSFIYDTSIGDLAEADSYYDGQTVQVVGEVVGDNISANADGSRRWITLTASGTSATVAVNMSAAQAELVDAFGRYGVTGTTLQVRGTFHLVCQDHEGISDLHAEHVSVVAKGQRHADSLDPGAFVPGLLAVVAGMAGMGVYYLLRERQR